MKRVSLMMLLGILTLFSPVAQTAETSDVPGKPVPTSVKK